MIEQFGGHLGSSQGQLATKGKGLGLGLRLVRVRFSQGQN